MSQDTPGSSQLVNPVDQDRLAQLETYAAELSRTHGQLRRHLQHLTVLHEVNMRIAAALDPDEVLAGVLDSLNQLLTYQTAAIYLLELDVALPAEGPHTVVPANSRPRLRAGRVYPDGPLPSPRGSLAQDEGSVLQAMQAQHSVGRKTSSGALALVVPLSAGGRSFGALDLRLAEPLDDDGVKILELLAAAAAVALQNAHLYRETQRLATTDALTGLSNYRHFHELLSLEVQRARRMAYPVGLVIMDLDHFKTVNDRHGHPVGDIALRLVADQLRGRLRRTDIVGRVGGEEFGAILPGDSLAEVAVVAEKMRRSIEELPPLGGGMSAPGTPLTLSVGGTSLGWEVVDAQLLVKCADQALYQAKRNGRNQVRLWSDPLPTEPSRAARHQRRSA